MTKKNKSNKGIMNTGIGWVISLVMIGVVIGALQVMGVIDVESALATARQKTEYLVECVPSFSCDFSVDTGPERPINPGPGGDIGYVGPENGEAFVLEAARVERDTSLSLLEGLTVSEPNEITYSRNEWKHWNTIPNRTCWTVRKQVLVDQAVPGTLKLVDKQKNPTDNLAEACAVGTPVQNGDKITIATEDSGEWIDPYSGVIITDSGQIDIDHIIPLHKVAQHGGQDWSSDKKQAYANDYEVLLATSAKENRSKSDKGPSEYMPKDKLYRCSYSKSYVFVASKYDISITQADKDTLKQSLESDCKV